MAAGFEGVILDIDGTLVDSNRFYAKAWHRAFKENSFEVPENEIRKLIGMAGDQIVSRLILVSEDSPVGKKICQRKKEIFLSEYLPLIKRYPGSRSLVKRLKKAGFKITIASSADPEEIIELLKIAQVEDLLSPTLIKGSEKSPAAAVNRAKADLAMPACKIVMLGDSPYDIEIAGQAGVSTIAFRSGGWEKQALYRAIAIYDDPEDLWLRFQSSPLGTQIPFAQMGVG